MHTNYILMAIVALAVIPIFLWAYLMITERVAARVGKRPRLSCVRGSGFFLPYHC